MGFSEVMKEDFGSIEILQLQKISKQIYFVHIFPRKYMYMS